MANTWIATPMNSTERVAQFRSSDFDARTLHDRFGDVAIYDLTDNLRPVCYVTATDRLAADGESRILEVTPADR